MNQILSISHLSKIYQSGFQALKNINLEIAKGEIFALLGQNGAGKTTLISIICGIVNPSSGQVLVDGKNIIGNYKEARSLIGLVPQELSTDSFETVWNTVVFSRGLYGKPANPALIEKILKDLSLWEKRNNKIMTLSGGMKRRLMIAKALSHEPKILFLDEPTAGVDVSLRRDMWELVRDLKNNGTTVILTTHYIEEAEEMADRIGIIRKGELINGVSVFSEAYRRADLPFLVWVFSQKALQPLLQISYGFFARNRHTISKIFGPSALWLVNRTNNRV